MNEKDNFNWMAHEMTPDLNLIAAKEQELSDILEGIADELGLSAGQFNSERENYMPSPEERRPGRFMEEMTKRERLIEAARIGILTR